MSTARLRRDRASKAPSADIRAVLARDAAELDLHYGAIDSAPSTSSQRRPPAKVEPARGLSVVASALSLVIARTAELAKAEQDELFDLFERNMRALYEASAIGYDAKAKRREILHAESRFLIARDPSAGSSLAGYVLCRFEVDEDVGGRKLAVVYCYELQVADAYRGKGLARTLMRCLRSLANAFALEKVMLTVFEHNDGARAFYEKLGYGVDETDPSHDPEEAKTDYSILSLAVAANG